MQSCFQMCTAVICISALRTPRSTSDALDDCRSELQLLPKCVRKILRKRCHFVNELGSGMVSAYYCGLLSLSCKSDWLPDQYSERGALACRLSLQGLR
jgi:hypothetical protein